MGCILNRCCSNEDSSVPSTAFNLPNYEFVQPLGVGAYGCVHEARTTDGTPVAIKTVKASNVAWESCDNVPCEVAMLVKCQHVPGVIKYIEYFEKDGYIHIVQEITPEAKDLRAYVKEHGPINGDQAKGLFIQIVRAVIGIHEAGVIHGDLKCDNILVDQNSENVKIIDFGYALPVHVSNANREAADMAPTMSGDNWEVGMLLRFMLTGTSLGEFVPDNLSAEARDLVESCLNRYPENRLSLEQILDHEWLK